MRLIHPRVARGFHDNALSLSLAMLVVGGAAVALMAIIPTNRVAPIALLALSAALGLGVGTGMAWRSIARIRRRREQISDDLGRLLASTLDDSYTLVLAPRLPGVPDDLAALLVGPAGVKAFIARRWEGRYRVRGRGWEYDTKSRAGWVPTLTNPSFDADAVATAVARWTRSALGEQTFAISPAVAFPRGYSTVVLEEPIGEVVTTDNAPWWAQRMGRVQRLDPRRAAGFVEEVLRATEEEALGSVGAASPNLA
jgi:hypothetical protein